MRLQAVQLVIEARRLARRQGVVEGFLQEFGLSTPEGLALMCLAEALLRTPDEATRDALIAEKIASADWSRHVGRSDSLFVNAGDLGADADRAAGRAGRRRTARPRRLPRSAWPAGSASR